MRSRHGDTAGVSLSQFSNVLMFIRCVCIYFHSFSQIAPHWRDLPPSTLTAMQEALCGIMAHLRPARVVHGLQVVNNIGLTEKYMSRTLRGVFYQAVYRASGARIISTDLASIVLL